MGNPPSKKLVVALAAAVLAAIALAASTITFAVMYEQEKDSNDEEAVTLWWVIFNKPENCLTNPEGAIKCGPVDAFGQAFLDTQAAGKPDLSKIEVNTASGFSMLYATATVTDGPIRMQASIYKTPEFLTLPINMDPMEQGVAFDNPEGAEVHAIVRKHGPYVDVSQTLSDMDDYCSDPLFNLNGTKADEFGHICADFQSVAFAPGEQGIQPLMDAVTGEVVGESATAELFRFDDSLIILVKSDL